MEKEIKKLFGILRANKNDVNKFLIYNQNLLISINGSCVIVISENQNDPKGFKFKDLGLTEPSLYEIGFQTDQLYKYESQQDENLNLICNYDYLKTQINNSEVVDQIDNEFKNLYLLALKKIVYPYFNYEKVLKKLPAETLYGVYTFNDDHHHIVFHLALAGFKINIITAALVV